ncbi:hypothetical protein Ahy_B03g064709 [Arachis hypogaea]|uniref:Uncharacterized protein n=1 Tax=Arachis hypogaea TaxID=3818 RepID=A0A445A069_ARAHY|nr:hypothetical protein Ahy_B03g064709 [Arachis hypogaea]
MSSSGRYMTIEWVGGCDRYWRMYVRGTTTSLPGSAQKLRRLCTFTGRPIRDSGISVSQTELTWHRSSHPSITMAQRPSWRLKPR